MSKEAREFLIDNGYMDSYVDDSDICNILEEYFAFRLGKLLLDGDIKMCDDGDTIIIGESQQFSRIDIELDKSGSKSVLKDCDDYKVCKTCGEDV
jgi:hypothetical protein